MPFTHLSTCKFIHAIKLHTVLQTVPRKWTIVRISFYPPITSLCIVSCQPCVSILILFFFFFHFHSISLLTPCGSISAIIVLLLCGSVFFLSYVSWIRCETASWGSKRNNQSFLAYFNWIDSKVCLSPWDKCKAEMSEKYQAMIRNKLNGLNRNNMLWKSHNLIDIHTSPKWVNSARRIFNFSFKKMRSIHFRKQLSDKMIMIVDCRNVRRRLNYHQTLSGINFKLSWYKINIRYEAWGKHIGSNYSIVIFYNKNRGRWK